MDLRVTGFVSNLSTKDVVENIWWKNAVEGKLEEEHIEHSKGIKMQHGMLNDNDLSLVSKRDRIDWTYRTIKPEPFDRLSAIGHLSDTTLEPFMKIIKKWLDDVCQPMNRLAFGATLGKMAADESAGYEEIQQYLPSIKLDLQNISDFHYQINRPKKLTFRTDISINRLSTWSVSLIDMTSEATSDIQKQHICMLELDINTKIEHTIPKNDAYAIFNELVTHGQKIADKGDTL